MAARRRRVAKLRARGLSAAAIARKVGVDTKLVEYDLKILRGQGLAATPARLLGVDGREYAGAAGDELVEQRALARRAAVDLAAASWSQAEVGRLVGVGSSTVGRSLAAAAAAAAEVQAREEARRQAARTLRWTCGIRLEDVASLLGETAATIAVWAPEDGPIEFPQTWAQESRSRVGVCALGRLPVATLPPESEGRRP